MKRIFIQLLSISILFISCKNKENSFVSELVSKTNETQSIHYNFTQNYYYSDGKDTTITPCEAWAVRSNEGSVKDNFVWVDNYYRPYNMIYVKGDLFLVIPPKKTTSLYNDFNESFISSIDWIDVFLDPELLRNQFEDTLNTSFEIDTVYNGENCKKVYIQFPISENGEKKSSSYIFSKKRHVPLWTMAKTISKNSVYYDEITFSNYSFNEVDISQLQQRKEKLIAENPVGNKASNSEVSKLKNMLQIGDKAPFFEGIFYNDNNVFTFEDYIGENIIIVDFWYTHCPPCVRAFPALIDLYDEYEEKGLKIFGVNSVDNQERSLDYLTSFLSKRNLNYDVILIQPEVDLSFKIKQYPTLYVIDKEGRIALVELGYNEEKFEHLREKVEELLIN
jgi:thiol-disulfide isomerase/thioredoxin